MVFELTDTTRQKVDYKKMNKVDWWENWSMRKLTDEKDDWWERWLMRELIDERVDWWERWLMTDSIDAKGDWWERWLMRESIDEKGDWWERWLMREWIESHWWESQLMATITNRWKNGWTNSANSRVTLQLKFTHFMSFKKLLVGGWWCTEIIA